jgi:hypothetical protein
MRDSKKLTFGVFRICKKGEAPSWRAYCFWLRGLRVSVVKLKSQKEKNNATCKSTRNAVSVITINYPRHVFMLINLNLKWKRCIKEDE